MRLVPQRSHRPEIMDRPDNPASELRGALADLGRINRNLGGRRALLGALEPWIRSHDGAQPMWLLDVGTGGADLPIALADLAGRLDKPIRVVAVDRDPKTAAIAGEATGNRPCIDVVEADAFSLPFGPRSFDVVTASLFLHHFRQEDVVKLLGAFVELARRAVVINDLRRHVVPWGFIWITGRLARLHPMVVHDGPLSVLRGFTVDELTDAAGRSGATRVSIERRWPYRLVLTLETT